MHQKGHVRRLSFGGAHGGGGVLRAHSTARFVSKTLGTYTGNVLYKLLSPCLFEVGKRRGARRAPIATGLKEGGAVTPRFHSLVSGPIGARDL
jgi:hypothetical protein